MFMIFKKPPNYQATPIIMVAADDGYTYGDGTTWYGKYSWGAYHTGNAPKSIVPDQNNRWMVFGSQVGDNSYSSVDGTPKLVFNEMTTQPNITENVWYDQSRSRVVLNPAFGSTGGDDRSSIVYSDDWGTSWTSLGTGILPLHPQGGNTRQELALTRSGNTELYLANLSQRFSYSTDGGISWTDAVGYFGSSSAYGLTYRPSDDRFYAAIRQGTRVVTSLFANVNSSNWTLDLGASPDQCWHIDINPATETICTAAGTAKIFRKPYGTGAAGGWTLAETLDVAGASPDSICFSPELDKWFCAYDQKMYVSTDDGVTWTEDTSFPTGMDNMMIECRERSTMLQV